MLEDIRVLEIARGLAGPVAGLMLAEFGADVLKVEPPGGDPDRTDAAFATWNRSKRSIELDLESAAGLARLRDLLGETDVLVHDLPPSKARELGLDDASLTTAFPRLIFCSVLGAPVGHRDAERSADELLVQARTGVLDEQDGFREGPLACRYPAGGWGGAQFVAAGVLTRLIMRRRTGRGGGVHTSLLQGMLAPMALVWSRNEKGMLSVPMPRPPRPNQASLYQCSDGKWLQIMDPTGKLDFASLPQMWEVMAEHEVDVDDMAQRQAAFTERPMEAWLKDLRACDTAVEPALSMGDVLRHPEAVANGYVVDVNDPVWGTTRQAAVPIDLSDPVKVRGPAPRAGEHNSQPWSGARAAADVAPGGAPEQEHPLTGLKVLDLGAFLAGPMAPAVLGDLGADVVKVEPLSGDRMRFMVRYFHAAARNKRSIAVDLTRPEGQEILARMAKWADVVHHNMRIKAASKIGVDEAGLRKHNPNLVFSYVSAYGLKGERANWPGYDSIFQAIGGWELENAGEGNAPVFQRAGTMDVLCAMNSLVGTLAALYEHEVTGKGTSAASSLLGVATFTQSETLIKPDGEFAPVPRLDPNQTGTSPLRRIYEAKDGWVAVSALRQADALCAAFGAASVEGLEAAARTQGAAALLENLAANGVPAEPVLVDAVNKVFDDASHKATQVVVGYEHAEAGLIEQPGAFFTFSDATTTLAAPLPPPMLGEHTNAILAELGYTAEEISALHQKGVVAGG